MTVNGLERLGPMRRAAARARRRLRYRAFLSSLARYLPLPLGYAAVVLAVIKLADLGADAQRLLLYGGASLLALALGVAFASLLRSPPRWSGALLLDEHHGLDGRLSTALELSTEEERTPLAGLAIEDGIAAAKRLDPRRAVAVPLPRELWVSLLLATLVVCISVLELRTTRVVAAKAAFDPLVLAADDLELFGAMADELAKNSEDPSTQAAIRRFNALIEDIGARRVDRKEALARLAELEAELDKTLDADREARKLGLDGLARELQRSGLTKAAAEALQAERLKDAEQALRELAERLKRNDKKITKAELDRLRQSFERAANVSRERRESLEQRKRELEEEQKSLLKKHKGDQKAAARDPKARENSRKLERLSRDKERADRAAEELSQLDRELAEAAEALKQEMSKGAEDVEQAAQSVNRMARRQMSEQEKRELLQRLRDLREVVRRQGQGGDDRNRQMQRFSDRARGKRPGQGESQQGGKPSGKGQPKAGGGIEMVEIPKLVEVPSPGQGAGREGDGDTGERAGNQAGNTHDPNSKGDATKPVGQTHDVTAAGIDSGQGQASAEVIYGAAERGFVGKGYRDVFVQYENVAEESLEHDTIPPGYRFYVRRYFQLIRPRD